MYTALFCPFAAGTVTWQAQDGAWTLTAIVRGTFSLVNGREAVLADTQEPVAADRFHEPSAARPGARPSLYAPSELVPYKPRTDVLLVGSAFAPEQTPVDALIARVAVEELDKSIGIIGDRIWVEGQDGLEPSSPAPFRSMSLRSERAARAPDNPAGFDLARPPELGALALPNLEALEDAPGALRSVGFGPVPADAHARRGLLHPEAFAWVAEGAKGPVPAGFDFAFYNAAPRDQQIGLLRNSGTLLLENLHREHARLFAKLPSVRPRAFLVSADGERSAEVALRCDTLWIDTDRALLSLTWRGLIGLETPETRGLDTLAVAAESRGRELRFKHLQRMLREGASMDEEAFSTTAATNPLGVRHDRVRSTTPAPAALPEPGPVTVNEARTSSKRSRSIDPSGIVDEASTLQMRPGSRLVGLVSPPSPADAAGPHSEEPRTLETRTMRYNVEPGSPSSNAIWEELSSSELLEVELQNAMETASQPAPFGAAARPGEQDAEDTVSDYARARKP